MSAELERLAAEFEKFQAKIKQAERKFGGVGEMQERMAELEAVATSPDRSVRVVAGAGGAVTDIQLTPDAMRLPSTTLSATIMETLRAAVAEAVRRQAGIVDETIGGDLGASTTEQVRQAQAEASGETPGTHRDDLPSHQDEPSAPQRRPARSDDDDFSDGSIYGGP
ncbi:MAG: YbaB/EbfC family nucleoid-associated protein [Actinophytocola sp.]|uniref:YbaB/EbfC family nucleoid-associated protein n=1 Tax=Actinophytocola sp. TaxID=1872138 RepID=UPI003D6BDB7E